MHILQIQILQFILSNSNIQSKLTKIIFTYVEVDHFCKFQLASACILQCSINDFSIFFFFRGACVFCSVFPCNTFNIFAKEKPKIVPCSQTMNRALILIMVLWEAPGRKRCSSV